jgi:uncharacterized protein YqgC (DUF456 family)
LIDTNPLTLIAPFLPLATITAGLVALFLAATGQRAGLILAAAMVYAYETYLVIQNPAAAGISQGFAVGWTTLMLATGFGLEGLVERVGTHFFRLDRQVLGGAAIGIVIAIFAFQSGITMVVIGAFLGALITGLMRRQSPRTAVNDALSSLVGIFGGKGLRLLCTLSVLGTVLGLALGFR